MNNFLYSHNKFSFFIDFILPRWKTWHKNDISKEQIKAAITAKLMNSHSKTKKKNLKGQQLNVEEDIFCGGTNNNDGDQQAESSE